MARVRRQVGTREALSLYEGIVFSEAHPHKGTWQQIFENEQPLHVEIGMGRGRFIRTMAQERPEINFIGVEVVEEIVLSALRRMERETGIPSNLRLIWLNAERLETIFANQEVQRIYLNFSDPWPKYKHRKRRLTHGNFLKQYEQILADNGEIHLKTDNQGFFEFSLNELAAYQWQLKNIQLDMYRKLPKDNIATEYELKFVAQNLPIYRLEAIKPIYNK